MNRKKQSIVRVIAILAVLAVCFGAILPALG